MLRLAHTETMNDQDQSAPLVFIDDAHTLGGTQIALAGTIRILLARTQIPVLCLCTARTRDAIEATTGPHPRLRFQEIPSALPLNLFAFPLRLPAYWLLLRCVQRQGVRAWWLNLPDIEFGLAPLLALKMLGQKTHSYLHGTGRFSFFYRAAGWRRRLLSRVRDWVADRFVFRLHASLLAPSRTSQAEAGSRITSRKRPRLGFLYPPAAYSGEPCFGSLRQPTPPMDLEAGALQLWVIGNVVQGHKNQHAALDVLECLVRQGHAATLTFAGDGPDLPGLRKEVLRRDLAARVTCLGWVAEPWALIPAQAILLIPSLHETMSLVAREAMHHGLRLVASPLPVFHEWIPAELIAHDFSPEAFVERILQVSRANTEALAILYQGALEPFSEQLFLDRFLSLTSETS